MEIKVLNADAKAKQIDGLLAWDLKIDIWNIETSQVMFDPVWNCQNHIAYILNGNLGGRTDLQATISAASFFHKSKKFGFN